MKIELTKTFFENGDFSIFTDCDESPFSKVTKEYTQIIEVDDNKWKKKEEQKK